MGASADTETGIIYIRAGLSDGFEFARHNWPTLIV
jgi:hypothetical protein